MTRRYMGGPAAERHASIVKELQEIKTELCGYNAEIRGKRVPRDRYTHLIELQARLKQRKFALEAEASKVKQEVIQENIEASKAANITERLTRPGMLTEYDLRNALCEPQTLLQQAYVSLQTLTSRLGRSEQSRALLDTIRDYLQRQGILL